MVKIYFDGIIPFSIKNLSSRWKDGPPFLQQVPHRMHLFVFDAFDVIIIKITFYFRIISKRFDDHKRVQGVEDSRPALSRRGDYVKYGLSFIMMIVY
jgi:hypothetical protein